MTSKISKKIVAVDIDMVVCDNLVRLMRNLTPERRVDHPNFYRESEMDTDVVIEGAVEALKKIRMEYKIVFLTARPNNRSDYTHIWLTKNNLMKDGDDLVVVDKQENKIPVLLEMGENIYTFIDDFKFNYQNSPQYNEPVLESLKKNKIPYVIFEGDWKSIIASHFSM